MVGEGLAAEGLGGRWSLAEREAAAEGGDDPIDLIWGRQQSNSGSSGRRTRSAGQRRAEHTTVQCSAVEPTASPPACLPTERSKENWKNCKLVQRKRDIGPCITNKTSINK